MKEIHNKEATYQLKGLDKEFMEHIEKYDIKNEIKRGRVTQNSKLSHNR